MKRMKRMKIAGLCGFVLLCSMSACKQADNTALEDTEESMTQTEAELSAYQSYIVSMGDYKGLEYTDGRGREATEEEVEEEIQAILLWYEDSELTDAWVQEHLQLDSVEAFRAQTKESLEEIYDLQAWKAAAKELYTTCMKTSEFFLEESETTAEQERYIESYRQIAEAADVSYEQYVFDVTGMTTAAFEEKAQEAAQEVVKAALVAQAIIAAEQMDAEDAYEEIAGQIAAEEGFDSVADLEQQTGGKSAVLKEVYYRLGAQVMMEQGHAVK